MTRALPLTSANAVSRGMGLVGLDDPYCIMSAPTDRSKLHPVTEKLDTQLVVDIADSDSTPVGSVEVAASTGTGSSGSSVQELLERPGGASHSPNIKVGNGYLSSVQNL